MTTRQRFSPAQSVALMLTAAVNDAVDSKAGAGDVEPSFDRLAESLMGDITVHDDPGDALEHAVRVAAGLALIVGDAVANLSEITEVPVAQLLDPIMRTLASATPRSQDPREDHDDDQPA